MVNITKEDLLKLFEGREEVFIHKILERTHGGTWVLHTQCKGRIGVNGQISINLEDNTVFKEAIGKLIKDFVGATVFAFIDTISTPATLSSSTDEVQALEKRVAHLEAELYKILPPDSQAPSSESAYDN